ncbi:FAD-dependent oxidoreductase [Aquisphaera insulae]|uniref:FAD-dependent oxidoreductase n=1 Tax=Aquisphaera insulae TaxID=2712864 RepID=UPI0013EB0F33|nr:FAD-dependent oxidoreductase [Aquisphaera insulae]
MRRRDFLAGLGAGTGAYTLAVRADGIEPTTQATQDRFLRVAPSGPDLAFEAAEPHMVRVALACDVLVAGGGMAGVCAALAAARNGATVVLIQDRSRLGGNSSSEVKMHVVGASCHKARPGWRESGLLEEIRLDDAVNNPQRSWELWDLLLYDKVMSEPRITLVLDTSVVAAEVKDGRIVRARARCDRTEHLYDVAASVFVDCTGDSRLALEAGAKVRQGRESRDEFGEPLAPASSDGEKLGSSILFTARDHGRPMPFAPPSWARKVTRDQLRHRSISSWEYGYWWIEWGGSIDAIRDNERIRFELLRIVMGVWDFIKNSGAHPTSANWALEWVGMIPGKRESRRIEGDAMLTQADLMGAHDYVDGVAVGGWPMDDHAKMDFDHSEVPPYTSIRVPVYNIPLRCLIAKGLSNLMMAGRNASCSHVAFTSTRVMGTCAVMGQAAGTAAAMAALDRVDPRKLYQEPARLRRLQQRLLRDDQTILDLAGEDPEDLARKATATASAERPGTPASAILDGITRDIPGGDLHHWSAPLGPGGAWIQLDWDQPRRIRTIQLTFDSGFQRELTLTASDAINQGIVRAPQPETVKDYELLARTGPSGDWRCVAKGSNNHRRLVRHEIDPTDVGSLRLLIRATQGDALARLFEIRCYA